MSFEIIQFIPRPAQGQELTDLPTIVFRSVLPSDFVLDCSGTEACELVESGERKSQ